MDNGRWKAPKKRFLMRNFIIQDGGKTKKKMGGRRPGRQIADPRNRRMKEISRRQRGIEASSEGGQGPEGL
jgi:hypothetical protein